MFSALTSTALDPFLDKSPVVPVAEPQLRRFMQLFLDALLQYPIFLGFENSQPLAECDVVWWVSTVIATIPEDNGDSMETVQDVLGIWFTNIHEMVRSLENAFPP